MHSISQAQNTEKAQKIQPEFWLSHPECPQGVMPQPRWPFWLGVLSFIGLLISAFLAVLLIALVVYVVSGSSESFRNVFDNTSTDSISFAIAASINVALLVTALLFARFRGRIHAWQFGIRKVRFWSSFGWAALAWVGMALLTTGAYLLISVFTDVESGNSAKDTVDSIGIDSGFWLLLLVINISAITGICEELFFRGFLFGSMRKWKGFWPAALLSSLMFGLVHYQSSWLECVFPFFFGFSLCVLYTRTKSIVPGIFVHGTHNAVVISIALDWNWQIAVLLPVVWVVQGLILWRLLAPRYVVPKTVNG